MLIMPSRVLRVKAVAARSEHRQGLHCYNTRLVTRDSFRIIPVAFECIRSMRCY